jgi:Xaa-Pro aminopeptidase
MNNFDSYTTVQNIAKETINYLRSIIIPGISEIEIKNEAESYMMTHGIESFWYYNVGALVFAGDRTKLSISGRNYLPSNYQIQKNDLVTVDLSPCIGKCWGDYARSFIVGDTSLNYGIEFEQYLHNHLFDIIDPEITFHGIYEEMNYEIERNGYTNLDFNGNLGHTIEESKDNRKYIEKGNITKVNEIELFTFEPHVKKINQNYGFKMENIYYLEDKCLCEL